MSERATSRDNPRKAADSGVVGVVPVVKIEQVEPAPRWVNVEVVVKR